MSEKPIIFSGPMVRAILEGRKTQTRRVVKPQPVWSDGGSIRDGAGGQMDYIEPHWLSDPKLPCAVGDVLLVREAWAQIEGPKGVKQEGRFLYRADACDNSGRRWSSVAPGDPDREIKWKPSIHMPRWASRITLNVIGVKVERLQDISDDDAAAEGVEQWGDCTWKDYAENGVTHVVTSPRESFQSLWKSIHGPGSWDANPWVSAISFERVTAVCNAVAM